MIHTAKTVKKFIKTRLITLRVGLKDVNMGKLPCSYKKFYENEIIIYKLALERLEIKP